MQFKFFFTVLFVAVCCAQESTAATTNKALAPGLNFGLIDDLIKQAQEAIKKLTDIIAKQVNEALETLNQLKDKVKELANIAIDGFKKQLQEIFDAAKKAIEEIKKKAEQLGVDITKCLEGSDDKLAKLFQNLLANEVSCVTDEVNKALNLIQGAIDIIQKSFDSVKNLPTRLTECINGSRPITCVAGVIADTAKLQAELPGQIAKKIAEVTEFVGGLGARLQVCAATQLANAGLETGKLVADITACAFGGGNKTIT